MDLESTQKMRVINEQQKSFLAIPDDRLVKALKDFKNGLLNINIWTMLAWKEIKQRYRRSILGPYWLTLSTALLLIGIGPLYGTLMGQNVSQYIYYVSISLVVWMFISSLISDGCQTFICAEMLIKQTSLPLTIYALQVVWRNVIILAHNTIIIIFVTAYFLPQWSWSLVTVPAAFMLIAINGIWICILFGIFSSRYRDIPQIITSLLQVLLFITPVMWRSSMLSKHIWLATYNPIFHFLEIVRAPLMGKPFPLRSWLVVMLITLFGFIIMFAFFQRYRSKVAYWV